MSDIEKNYTNGEITVNWKPSVCIHSAKCWKGLIEVFNPRQKPWVNLGGSTTEAIMNQVNQCPSGALSWKKNSEIEQTNILIKDEMETQSPVEIIVTTNGSLKILGKVVVKDESGNILHEGEKTFLCRCGHSSKKPFCDSSHKKIGFVG